MSPIVTTGTVGEWTSRNFRAVQVIEKYGIDFHSEAGLPLEEACAKRGLDLVKVVDELTAASQPRTPVQGDWQSLPLARLMEHLVVRHHVYLKIEMPRLRPRLDKMAARHGERDGGLLRKLHAVYCDLQAELDLHLHKEETILFPFIDRCEAAAAAGGPAPRPPFGTVANPIRMMVQEHDSAQSALDEMRLITRDYVPADYACANFRAVFNSLEELDADLREHIRLENEFLFPRAVELEKRLSA